VTKEKAISDKPSTWITYEGFYKGNNDVEMNEVNGVL